MKCILPGSNVKVLGRAVQTLAKFGEEIHLAALPEGLSLRAVNSCRSAYTSFLFSHLCFLHYDHRHHLRRHGDARSRRHGDDGDGGGADAEEKIFRCKISVKAMLSVFRATGSMDKAVEQCCIRANTHACRLLVHMQGCRGVTTTRRLCYSDGENVEASYSKADSANELRAPARLLSDSLVHFHGLHDEVTLSTSSSHIFLSNAPDDGGDSGKGTRTELSVDVAEFELVRLRSNTRLTFCLKETKGMLLFAESSNYPVSIYFDRPGRPIIFSVQDSVLEANFVLATQSEIDQSQPREGQRSRSPVEVDDFDDMDSFMAAIDTSHMSKGDGDDGDVATTSTSIEEPGRKKLRALFFEPPSQLSVSQDVLAEDSEPE